MIRTRLGCRWALLRGTRVNGTYVTHKNLYIYLFLLTILPCLLWSPVIPQRVLDGKTTIVTTTVATNNNGLVAVVVRGDVLR